MSKLSLESVNKGSHHDENDVCNFFASLNDAEIRISDTSLWLKKNNQLYSLPIQFMEKDFITDTWQGRLSSGDDFRIVRPNQRFLPLTGDTVTFASMYHDGYAVSFNIISL